MKSAIVSSARLVLRVRLLLIAGAIFSTAAAAQSLRDPTRPAFEVDPQLAAPGSGSAAGMAVPRRSGPQLQSILRRANGVSLAVIDGRSLRVGDRFGDARIVAIGESEVVLSGTEGRRTLRLTPTAKKQQSRAAAQNNQTLPPAAPQGRDRK